MDSNPVTQEILSYLSHYGLTIEREDPTSVTYAQAMANLKTAIQMYSVNPSHVWQRFLQNPDRFAWSAMIAVMAHYQRVHFTTVNA